MEETENLQPQSTLFPTGKREFRLLAAMLLTCVLTADFVCCGGLNLGFAVCAAAIMLISTLYLPRKGRMTRYSTALTVLGLVIALSFLRSGDGFVKFIMVCFLLISGNINQTLIAGQNRRSPDGAASLLDAPRALFSLGVGQMGNALGGVKEALQNAGPAGKRRTAVLLGLAAAIPVVAILIPLLIRADAAFEGLIGLLPEFDFAELICSLILGLPLGAVLYTRSAALHHGKKAEPAAAAPGRLSALTVNTVLFSVCGVYLVYLASQLAYFVGGFSGILPEGYTHAEYARRGFFEMAWLSFLNLAIITAAVALVERREGRAPLLTRLLCLFTGIVSLFFVATASAKMLLYIGSYGLTRLRLLTEVIMIFIALTVVFVTVWLFKPKFAYMKAVLLSALILGACVAWADVDTVVAAYNVSAYQSGQLSTVDVYYLGSLGNGAVPYLDKLAQDDDRDVAEKAQNVLKNRRSGYSGDLRSFNIAAAIADEILEDYH